MIRAGLDPALIGRAPKVLLHDHLDGGLRPATIIELARGTGLSARCRRPTRMSWHAGSGGAPTSSRSSCTSRRSSTRSGSCRRSRRSSGSPPSASRTWLPTASCTPRFATRRSCQHPVRPEPGPGRRGHPRGLPDRIRAGALTNGRPIVVRFLATAMRQADRAAEIAELALRHRADGVVGFDIAGPEAGYPPGRFADVFHRLVHANFHLTLHAGEGYGLPSIREALDLGAERLGHGVRIVDDIAIDAAGEARLGRAGRLRPRPAHPARAVPDLERPHRRRRVDRDPSDRPAPPAALPGHGQHRQPADEPRQPVERAGRPRCGLRPRASTRSSG